MKFILLTHEREINKKTNTGRLVKNVLSDNVELIVWKRKEPSQFLISLLETKKAALVFPCEETKHCSNLVSRFEYLVILDATWQQAQKMYNQSPYLHLAERVSLSITKPSEYKLRRNQLEGGLSTAECVIELLRQTNNTKNLALLEAEFHCFNNKTVFFLT